MTVVIIRKDLLARSRDTLPGYLNFKIHAEEHSLWNTPPTFAIYVLMLVTKWLLTDIGGLTKMQARNRAKAKLLYDAIDASGGFYTGHAQPDCRSMMNVTFRLPSDELTDKFVEGREGARPDRPARATAPSAASGRRSTTRCRSRASKRSAISWMSFASHNNRSERDWHWIRRGGRR